MEIKDDLEHETALRKVYELMNKPEESMTNEDLATLDALAKAIEYYENHVLKIMPLREEE